MSEVTTSRGQQAYEQGDYTAAVAAFREAREAARQAGRPVDEASALRDMGVTLQRAGKLHEAGAAYDEAAALFETAGDDLGYATVMGNRATLLRRQGKQQEAEALLAVAANCFADLGNAQYEADTFRLLAQWQMQRGAWIDSMLSYNKAMARMKHLSPVQHFLRFGSNLILRALGAQ